MDSHWKDVLLLLRGEANIGVICDALIDIIDLNLHFLPDVFHEVSFALLTQSSINTRVNSSLLLGKLCSHFSSILLPLICESNTDGVLIQIEDIDIASIVSCHSSILYNVKEDAEIGDVENLYTQDWLKRQRKELLKQIGLHSYSTELVSNEVLDHIDIGLEGFLPDRSNCASNGSNDAEASSEKELQVNLSKAATNETWLARIMRCMIAGLMSPQWECRHGYAIGLNQMVGNLSCYSHPHNQMQNSCSNRNVDRVLPEFLSNDILSCGLCVLLLDRFMDFDYSSDCVLSPVKESVGELLSTALRSALSAEKYELFWRLVNEMILSDHHWTITLGGLIACRHFIVIKFDMVFFDKYENLMSILQSKLDGARGRADEDEMSIEIAKLLLALNNEVLNRFSAARIHEFVFLDACLFVSRVSIMTKVLRCLLYRLHVLEDALDQPRSVELEQMTSNHLMLLMDVQLSSCSALFHLLSNSTAKSLAPTTNELIAAREQLTLLLTMQSDLLVHAIRHNENQLQIHCFSNLFQSVTVMRDILKLRLDLNYEAIGCPTNEHIANYGEHCFILFGRILAFVSMIFSANGTNEEPPVLHDAPVQPSKATLYLMKNLSDRSLWSDCAIAVVELLSLGFSSTYRSSYKDNKIDRLFHCALTTIINMVLVDISNKDDPTASNFPTCAITDEVCIKLVSYAVRAFRLMSSSFHVCNLWAKGSDLLRSRFIVFMTRLISYAMDPPTLKCAHTINCAMPDNICMAPEDFSKFIHKSCEGLLDHCKLVDERQSNKPKRTFAFVFVADTSIAENNDQLDDSTHRKIDGRKRKRPMNAVDESITSDVGTLKRKSPRDLLCYELESLLCFSVEVMSTLTHKMVGSIDWQSIMMHDFDHTVRVAAKGAQRTELCIILRFLASLLSSTSSAPLASLLHEDSDPLDLSGSCNTVISNSIVKNMIHHRNDSKDHDVGIMIEQLMQLGRHNGSLSNIARLVMFATSQVLKQKAFELFLPVIEESLKTDSCCSCIQFIPCLVYAFKRDDSLCSTDEDRVIQLLLGAICRKAVNSEEFVNCIVDSICALLYSPTVRSDGSMSRKKNIHLYSLSQWTSKQRIILNRVIEFIYNSISSSAETTIKSISTKLFVQLSLRLKENIIICYQKWFSTALYGLGDADAGIRRSSIEVFRMVVPMAPIAKQRSHQKCRVVEKEEEEDTTTIGDSSKVVESSIEDEGDSALSQVLLNLFSKETSVRIDLSKTDVDMKIIATLQQLTNLVDSSVSSSSHPSSTIKPLSSAKLRDYQWSGISWLTQLRRFGLNGILADDMGIGKSIQALTMLAIIRIEKDFNTCPSIVVCPASLLLHWSDEVQKFFPPQLLSPVRIMKQSDFMNTIQNASSESVCLVSYDMLRREMSRTHASSLRGQLWELVVLDEAHLIKNPLTETAKCIFQLKGKHRIALTGTPIQNQVQELWSLMNFILPDYLGPFKVFQSEVVRPLKRSYAARQSLLQSFDAVSQSNNNTISNKVYSAIEITSEGLNILRKLHKQILPFILRRTKFAVAKELPSKTIIDIICPLSEIQTQLYTSYQTKCDINDDILEKELVRLKNGEVADEDEHIMNIHDEKGAPDEDEDEFQSNLDGWSTGNSVIASSSKKKVSGYHPFKALSYLKLLCVHPAMVVEEQHASYRKHLLERPTSSGKLLRLASLLVESGVVTADEISPEADYDDLLHVGVSHHPTSSGHRGATYVASEGDSPHSSDQEDGSIGDKKDTKKRRVGDPKVAILDPSASPSIHRCLIFAQHKATLDLVESCVLQRYFPSINYERLDGDTNAHKRSIVAKAFNDQQLNLMGSEVELEQNVVTFSENIQNLQADKIHKLSTAFPKISQSTKETKCCVDSQKDIRLLLMTTRSCGLGLNLTAADTVIFVENDWNPCVDQQAMDRSHRIGQSQPVTVYRLLAQSTIEARIMSLQELKQQVAAQVLCGDGAEDTTQDAASNNNFGRVLWDSLLQNDQVK